MFRRTAALAMATMLAVAGCGSGGGSEAQVPSSTVEQVESTTSLATTTSSTTTTTTTTTEPPLREFEPLYADPNLSIEEQVEAAYLFHWEVLLDSGRTGRTDYLPLVFTGEALDLRIAETVGFVEAGRRIGGHVEHEYGIVVISEDEVVVIDDYMSRLTDIGSNGAEQPAAGADERHLYRFHLRQAEGQWRVFKVVRYRE